MRALTLTLALMAVAMPAVAETSEHVPEGYNLVWADEFNTGDAPDLTKWSYDTFRNKDGWFNEELQYYADNRRENARLEDGKLIIEAHKEDLSHFPDWGGQKYSSTRLLSRGKGEWAYGFYDIRAKLPCGVGHWPAIWLLGTGNWPDSGEIDIMEAVGYEPTLIYAHLHTRYSIDNGVKQGDQIVVMDYCSAFHNYQVEWTPDYLEFYVDGTPYYRFDKPSDDPKKWPFDGKHFMILNVAIGGTWGGQKGVDDTRFPARMEVDYVRVYQK